MAKRSNLPVLTRDIAFAAGQTAADIRMHRAGRTAWNDDERDLAVRTTNKLLLSVPFEMGGLGGIPFNAEQLADLGLTEADMTRAAA